MKAFRGRSTGLCVLCMCVLEDVCVTVCTYRCDMQCMRLRTIYICGHLKLQNEKISNCGRNKISFALGLYHPFYQCIYSTCLFCTVFPCNIMINQICILPLGCVQFHASGTSLIQYCRSRLENKNPCDWL